MAIGLYCSLVLDAVSLCHMFVFHTVCNHCVHDLRIVAMQMSNTVDKMAFGNTFSVPTENHDLKLVLQNS